MSDDSSKKSDYSVRFSNWPHILSKSPEEIQAEFIDLQQRVLMLEKELAALRRNNIPNPQSAQHLDEDSKSKPTRPPEWEELLKATPVQVRDELTRLEETVQSLRQEIAKYRRCDLLPKALRPPATTSSQAYESKVKVLEPKVPLEKLAEFCKKFGIESIKAFNPTSTEEPENGTHILFVKFKPGIDPDTVSQQEIEWELMNMFGWYVDVRFL